MSESSLTLVVEMVKRMGDLQRELRQIEQTHSPKPQPSRHPRLWQLVTEIQHEAGRLAHLIEDSPAGSSDAYSADEVLRRIAAIRQLIDDAVILVVFADEGEGHATQ